ncbi:PorV/PorQ family protein [bacterium]|nr:PorV/PorQ family protein [bacterium]
MEQSNKWVGAYWIWVAMVFALAASPAMGASTGTTGASFLKVAVGPRAAAMGTAYTAVAEEPYASYYNPAAIAGTDRWELSAMHQDQFAQVSFDYVGLAAPAIRGKSAWGVSIVRMAVDDYFRSELDDGSKFTNQDLALTGTYAHRIVKPLAIGASFKLIRQTLANINASGWAVDLGAHLKVNPRLSLGASLSNMGPDITFISIGDPLPTTFRVGGAFRLLPRGNLLATMDYWIPKDDADAAGIGLEYRPSKYFALRGGYQIGSDFTGFDASTYGVTFSFEHFGIEYAFIPREKLGDVHRAGLNVRFGGSKPEVVASRPERQVRRRARQMETPREEPRQIERRAPAGPPASTDRSGSAESYYQIPVQREAPKPVEEVPAEVTAAIAEASQQSAFSDHMALRRGVPAPLPVDAQTVKPPVVSPPTAVEEARPLRREEPLSTAPPPTAPPPPEASPSMAPLGAGAAPSVAPRAVSDKSAAITQEKISIAAGLLKQARYEEAIVIIRSGLSEDPVNVPLWYLLSETYYKAGEYDRSMEAVSRALEILQTGPRQ